MSMTLYIYIYSIYIQYIYIHTVYIYIHTVYIYKDTFIYVLYYIHIYIYIYIYILYVYYIIILLWLLLCILFLQELIKWRGEVPSVPVTIKIAARRTSMERSRRQNCCPHNMGTWNEYIMEIQPTSPMDKHWLLGVTLEDIWGPGKTYSKQWTTSQRFSSSCANVVA